MIIRYKSLTLLTVLSLVTVFACVKRDNDQGTENAFKVDKHRIIRGDNLSAEDWKCYKVNSDLICCPKNWMPVDQDKIHFFSYIDSSKQQNSFFAISKYNVNDTGLGLEQYLKEGYSQLRSDSMETFKGYTLKELIFERDKAYYGEYFTEFNDTEYISYSMYRISDGYLYDFTLKVDTARKAEFYNFFQDVLFNFKADNDYLFERDDELQEIKLVNLDTVSNDRNFN